MKELIKIFTDEGDVVIDPCAGSGSTLRACKELNRSCYGFEIKKNLLKEQKRKCFKGVLKYEKSNNINFNDDFIKWLYK